MEKITETIHKRIFGIFRPPPHDFQMNIVEMCETSSISLLR